MRVLLSTYGSRGDTEPLAAVAVALKALGAEARVSAPADPEFVDLLDRAGVELAPAFMPVRQWIAEKGKPGPGGLPALAAEMLPAQYESILAAAEGCDLVVATGLMPSAAAAREVAQTRGLAYAHVGFCPAFIPSEHHPPLSYPGAARPPEGADNRTLWRHNVEVMSALFGGAVNAQRAALGRPPVDDVRRHVFTDRPLLASDPALWPWTPTDLCDAVQTGAWILPDARPLPDGLEAFLGGGDPPVYVGFGSLATPGAKGAAPAAIAAIRAHGRRAVVGRGWAELNAVDDADDCFVVGDVNQQALFPRVAAVIHHGGAGATTTAAGAGAPQVIVPQIADQPYWAARVAGLGVGVAHDGPVPTFESLADALQTALASETRERAAAFAGEVRVDGAMVAAKLLLDGRVGLSPGA